MSIFVGGGNKKAMPQLNFVNEGKGPVVVLGHALGGDLSMWDDVARQLRQRYTVLRYDHRGHGRSPVIPGPCSIEALADDAAALIDEQIGAPVHYVGLSMGGMVAQQLAARHPRLVGSIVVANSSSYFDETGRAVWRARIETARNHGMAGLADSTMARWFTPEFRAAEGGAERVAELRRRFEAMDPGAYAACGEAVSRIEFCSTNPRIACPTLVIAGTRDEATPPAMSQAICNSISGAVLTTIAAAHLSAVEKPAEFAKLVADFLKTL